MIREEDVVGFALKALESTELEAVAADLRFDADGRRLLGVVQETLRRLECDRDGYEPPPDLRLRTLARIAEHRARAALNTAPAPVPPPPPSIRTEHWGWWRRADVLVAASLLIVSLGLLLPWLVSVHRTQKRAECQYNLEKIYTALITYGQLHGGDLPRVEERPPLDFAGVFASVLHQESLLGNISLACPGTGKPEPPRVSIQELQVLYETQPDKYQQMTQQLGGGYAYTMGYRDADSILRAVRFFDDQAAERLAIVADRPSFASAQSAAALMANSDNHGGEGQNVLHVGGNVEWYKTRSPYGDDIYLNRAQQVDAGVDRFDSVLGASAARLIPLAVLEH